MTGGLLTLGILSSAGCGGDERDGERTESNGIPGSHFEDASPAKISNAMSGLPGMVYESQVDSAIHWQPWTPETIALAERTNRIMLVVVAMPQQPSYMKVLDQLAKDTDTVALINSTYIPVLIDGDAIREMSLLSADLCAEIGKAPQLPLMVWLSPEKNPVAWIPLGTGKANSVVDDFAQSNVMVSRVWTDDPGYVTGNSKADQANRRERFAERWKNRETSKDPESDAPRALRQLASFYDPVSRAFDGGGGLFPSGALDFLSMGAGTKSLPESLRTTCREVLEALSEDLLSSAMFDQLDGGVYSSRRHRSWALPGFYRDSATQARVAISLLHTYEITGDKRALERALGVIAFMEKEFVNPDGTFSLGSSRTGEGEAWMWQEEEVREVLDKDTLEVWLEATGMKEMGNLPSEADPGREFFRSNTIGFVKDAEEIARNSGKTAGEVSSLLEKARSLLLKVRDDRTVLHHHSRQGNAAATFRAASAYAAAFRVTRDPAYLEKATNTLLIARKKFSDGPRLLSYDSDSETTLVAGRAFLYGIAMLAAIDVWTATTDDKWLSWAEDLATTTAELFATPEGLLRECPPEARLMELTISDSSMLFEESTAGVVSLAGARLAALGRPLLPILDTSALELPMSALVSPISHTDLIYAALVRHYGEEKRSNLGIADEMKTDPAGEPTEDIESDPGDGESSDSEGKMDPKAP